MVHGKFVYGKSFKHGFTFYVIANVPFHWTKRGIKLIVLLLLLSGMQIQQCRRVFLLPS